MLKKFIVLLLLSALIIFAMPYGQQAIQLLLNGHDTLSQLLTDVFSVGHTGNVLRGFISLLAIPLLIGFIPSLLYWIVRKQWFPYFMEIVWIIWLLQVGALLAIYKVAA